MRRRTLLSAVAAGVAGTAGCLTAADSGVRAAIPAGVAAVEFASHEAPDGDRSPPKVDVRSDSRVVVTGTVKSGPPECNAVRVENLTYREGTLRVVLGTWTTGGGCDGYARTVAYEARLSFEDGLPDRIVVRERNAGDKFRTRSIRVTEA